MPPLSDTDVAYLAGIVDGEGSISLQRNNNGIRPKPVLAVDSTDRELLEWIVARIGGTIIKKKKYAARHSQAWTWRVTSRKARQVLALVLPFLVIRRKRERARILVDEWASCSPASTQNYTPELSDAKDALVERFFSV